MVSPLTAEQFYRISFPYINHTTKKSVPIGLRRFKSFFGVTPQVCAKLWNLFECNNLSQPKHLLWALLFLKQNGTEHERRSILKSDEKTIRKWTWVYVELLGKLNLVFY